MIEGLAQLNGQPRAEAEEALYRCFASRIWAAHVAGARPFAGIEQLIGAADAAWSRLSEADWLAAFAAHPRIGERGGHAPDVSAREQKGLSSARQETLAALAAENRDYERRFGHVFLIAASGRTAGEILAELRRRLNNDPATELRVAADEQRKITRLRLERLVAG